MSTAISTASQHTHTSTCPSSPTILQHTHGGCCQDTDDQGGLRCGASREGEAGRGCIEGQWLSLWVCPQAHHHQQQEGRSGGLEAKDYPDTTLHQWPLWGHLACPKTPGGQGGVPPHENSPADASTLKRSSPDGRTDRSRLFHPVTTPYLSSLSAAVRNSPMTVRRDTETSEKMWPLASASMYILISPGVLADGTCLGIRRLDPD